MTRTPKYEEYAATAELYDFVTPYASRPDAAFFVEMARETGGPVLELGSGTGRVLIPTARLGIPITGLDLSPDMLAVCRRKLAAEPPEVQSKVMLVEGDMRDFDLPESFHLVTMPFRPFQHLIEVEDQLACLDCIHRHLADDGKVVVDVFNPMMEALVADNLGQEMTPEPEFTTPDGRKVIRKHKIVSRDFFKQVQQNDAECPCRADGSAECRTVHIHVIYMQPRALIVTPDFLVRNKALGQVQKGVFREVSLGVGSSLGIR